MATSPSRDLSHAGVGFHLLSAANGAFGAGDVLRVQFKLFPNASLLVKKEAVVRQISDRRANATFREPLKNEDDFLLKFFSIPKQLAAVVFSRRQPLLASARHRRFGSCPANYY